MTRTTPFHRTRLALACTACVLATSGCALLQPDDGRQANGDAARNLLAQQVLNPEAPRQHAGRVPATSGRTTRETADRLVITFKEPPPANVISIGVGGR
jgi:hypothetical protein